MNKCLIIIIFIIIISIIINSGSGSGCGGGGGGGSGGGDGGGGGGGGGGIVLPLVKEGCDQRINRIYFANLVFKTGQSLSYQVEEKKKHLISYV